MLGRIRKLLRVRPAAETDERILVLERELQSLRLEHGECERELDSLRREIERRRAAESRNIDVAIQSRWGQVLEHAAGPAVQLLTQDYLLDVERKPVSARDVMAVAKRLVGVLQDAGLTVESAPGQRERFDPARHELLRAEDGRPKIGEPVEVKFAGASYRGRIILKTGVVKI